MIAPFIAPVFALAQTDNKQRRFPASPPLAPGHTSERLCLNSLILNLTFDDQFHNWLQEGED